MRETDSWISASVLMPVETTRGRPSRAAARSRSWLVRSAEAILIPSTPYSRSTSRLGRSQGVHMTSMPRSRQWSKTLTMESAGREKRVSRSRVYWAPRSSPAVMVPAAPR